MKTLPNAFRPDSRNTKFFSKVQNTRSSPPQNFRGNDYQDMLDNYEYQNVLTTASRATNMLIIHINGSMGIALIQFLIEIFAFLKILKFFMCCRY